ncbi:hypothetical protein P7C70_g3080, partial [Phenoliferia sp. Uapishka_3]
MNAMDDSEVIKKTESQPDLVLATVQSVDNKQDLNDELLDAPPSRRQRISAIASVFFAGIAILSGEALRFIPTRKVAHSLPQSQDGYNGAIVGNIELILLQLYPVSFTSDIYTRTSNAFLIGEVFGMLFFGFLVDVIGRKTGVVATTVLLVLGCILSAAASGKTETGMWWMLIISRGLTGFGAGARTPDMSIAPPKPYVQLADAQSSRFRIGRRRMMTIGFLLQAVLGFIIGGTFNLLVANAFGAFVFLYALFVAMGEVGPGSGIILVSAESFPTAIRGQGLGIAAAFGKAGAAIGAQVFTAILAKYDNDANPNKGSQVAFLIGSAFAVLGAAVAWFGLIDQRADLEIQDRAFREILTSEGVDTSNMGYSVGKDGLEEKGK